VEANNPAGLMRLEVNIRDMAEEIIESEDADINLNNR
jgi:hypothetical protein